MTAPTPVTILGGYLGSGKTTLVNHLLHNANGIRIAVMVNDFGDLPIDASLIESSDRDVINLSGGCVCCSYGNDLTMALLQLKDLPNAPEHVLIEASGVALPGAIAGSLSLLPTFELDGVVVLADAYSVNDQASDRYIGDTIARQLSDADLILVNKIDQLESHAVDELVHWIESSFPDRPVITTTHAELSPDVALGIETGRVTNDDTGNLKHHTAGFDSVNLTLSEPVDVKELSRKLINPEYKLMRAKGFATDLNGERKTIQIVGTRSRITDAPKNSTDGIVCIGRTEDMQRFEIQFGES